MTLRLADIGTRIESVEQLGSVVNAMRGIAAARAQQAHTQVEAVDSYTASIEAAIGRAVALMPSAFRAPSIAQARPAVVMFGAEQGFAGAFSEHVFASLGDDLSEYMLFLVGTRGATVLAERGIEPEWHSAMPSHSAGIPKLADHLSEALYLRIAKGEIVKLDVVFRQRGSGGAPENKRAVLLPLDLARFPKPKQTGTPLHNLAPAELLAG